MLILPAQAATSGRACRNTLRQIACQTNMRKKNTVAWTPGTTARPVPGAGRRVTSYDVALLAGVSQSAVSRCFKPGASISPATHAKVMQAAISLDYIPWRCCLPLAKLFVLSSGRRLALGIFQTFYSIL